MRTSREFLAGSMFVLGLSMSSGALNAEKTDSSNENILVIRGSAEEERVDRSLVQVDEQAIKEVLPASAAEQLRYQSNIQMSGGPRSNNQSVNIRGIDGARILQTVDGVRQNLDSGHRPSYYLDPILLKSLEVLKGPSSSLWGSGAVGGVVAQQTIDPSDILLSSQDFGGMLRHQYNDNGEGSATTLVGAYQDISFDILTSAYNRERSNITLGNGLDLINSAYEDSGHLIKSNWFINDEQILKLNFREANNRGTIPTNGTAQPSGSNFDIFRDSENQQVSLDYNVNIIDSWLNTQVLLFQNQISADEIRVSDFRFDQTELTTTGLNVNNQSSWGSAKLLYGFDYFVDDFSAVRSGINRPAPPISETDVLGTFFHLNYSLSDAVHGEFGIRQDRFSTKANNLSTKRSDSASSLSLGLEWRTSTTLTFALRYDEAFRAPSSEELYTTGTHFCIRPGFCNRFVSNSDLEPEQAKNLQLISRFNLDSLIGSGDTLRLDLVVFNNKIDNFIEQVVQGPVFFPVPDAGFTTWRNVDEALIRGLEIDAIYSSQLWRVAMTYGETKGLNDATNEALFNIPAAKLVLDISRSFFQERLLIGTRFIDVQNQFDVPEDLEGYRGYNLHDLYLQWRPLKQSEQLSFELVVQNLNDRFYRRAFEQIDAAGREVKGSVSYRF